jgi:hypothetical protein
MKRILPEYSARCLHPGKASPSIILLTSSIIQCLDEIRHPIMPNSEEIFVKTPPLAAAGSISARRLTVPPWPVRHISEGT